VVVHWALHWAQRWELHKGIALGGEQGWLLSTALGTTLSG